MMLPVMHGPKQTELFVSDSVPCISSQGMQEEGVSDKPR